MGGSRDEERGVGERGVKRGELKGGGRGGVGGRVGEGCRNGRKTRGGGSKDGGGEGREGREEGEVMRWVGVGGGIRGGEGGKGRAGRGECSGPGGEEWSEG